MSTTAIGLLRIYFQNILYKCSEFKHFEKSTMDLNKLKNTNEIVTVKIHIVQRDLRHNVLPSFNSTLFLILTNVLIVCKLFIKLSSCCLFLKLARILRLATVKPCLAIASCLQKQKNHCSFKIVSNIDRHVGHTTARGDRFGIPMYTLVAK